MSARAIDAHPATVFALLNDFHQVNKWSRWIATDPNARIDISGPTRGVGATMTWSGNIIGNGTQVIVSSEPLAAAISEAMGNAYFAVLNFMDRHGLQEAGAPLSISRAFDGSELRFDAGIPVRGIMPTTPRVQDSVRLGRTYSGPVIRVKHRGSYLRLGQTHNKMAAYLDALGISRNGDAWESYVSDPTRTDESELITHIFYPISAEN